MHTSRSFIVAVSAFVAMALGRADAWALSGDLQGLHKNNSTNYTAASAWTASNLQDWKELDYIPCRILLTGGPGSNEVSVIFPHFMNGTPGFQNLYFAGSNPSLFFLSNTPNVVISGTPTLNAPMGVDDWSYTLNVTVTNNQTAYIYFYARLAAGAHLNVGSSLQLRGEPSLSPLQIHKPGPGPGSPDLAVVKTGPSMALPNGLMTYTLTYTNKATSALNVGTGVQLTDILPNLASYVADSATGGGTLAGNTLSWDLPNLTPGASGTLTYQVRVLGSAIPGQTMTNNALLLSAEDDANATDNRSRVVTTVAQTNRPPVANGDSYTVNEDSNLVVNPPGVLANDNDPEGGALTALLVSTTTNGILSFSTNGGFTYTPNSNYFGPDSFSYQASDGTNLSAIITVSINVLPVNDAPAVAITNPISGSYFSAPASFPVQAIASDIDGSVTNVQIFNGTTLIGNFASGPYSVPLSNLLPGTYHFTAVATDDGGLRATSAVCSVTVTTTPPALVCANTRKVELGSTWTFDPPAVTVSCGTNAIAVIGTTTNYTCGVSFTATRTWRVTDQCGNTAECSQTVLVEDHTPPAIVCPAGKTVELGAAWTFDAPSATDLNSNTIAIVSTVTNRSGLCGSAYVATRTWRATDVCGNTNDCSQVVTVVDTTPPNVTCVPNKTVELGNEWTFDAPTASDLSSNTIAIVGTSTNRASSCGGGYVATRVWSAIDSCGNSNGCSQVVTVVDTTSPAIVCAANKTVELGSVWTFDAPTATDLSSNTISTVSTSTNRAGSCGNGFVATRVWSAIDACGNSNGCSQAVTVVDTTAPAIVCATNKSVELGVEWLFDAPTSSDLSSNIIEVVSTVTNAGACGNAYTAIRTWSAVDACGNSNGCSQTVFVVDTTAPAITCAPAKTVELGAEWNFDAPTATDLSSSSITVVSTVTNAGTCGNGYIAIRTWSAIDACGNSNGCSQVVTVVDTTAPAITCAPGKTVELGVEWAFDAPSATDLSPNSITVVSTVTNTTESCGNGYVATRTWSATDACGNSNTCSQVVNVVDTTPPAIVCVTNKIVELGVEWTFDVPVATDLSSNGIAIVSTVTNAGPCGAAYTAIRTWSAVDACGNSNGCSQLVTLVDTTPPTIACATNKTVELGANWSFDTPTVTDLSSNTIAVVSIVTNATCGNAYVATCTWSAIDACGNSNGCSQIVTVVDTTAPIIACAANKTVEVGSTWGFDPPAATDLSSNSVTVVGTSTNSAEMCGNGFVATRTWRATDACGNYAECSQVVTVRDTTPPTVTIVSPTNGFQMLAPAAFTVVAEAHDAGGIANVQFFNGTTFLTNIASLPYFFIYTNVPNGSNGLIAVTTDLCGYSSTSTVVSVFIYTNVAYATGQIAFNRQATQFEQYVTVSNLTSETWANGFRLWVFTDTNSQVVNASGFSNNVPYLDVLAPVVGGANAQVLVKYYSATRVFPVTKFRVEPFPYTRPIATAAPMMAPTLGSTFPVKFATVAGRWYFVQTSDDLKNWVTDPTPIRGTGAPAEVQVPQTRPQRFFRSVVIP